MATVKLISLDTGQSGQSILVYLTNASLAGESNLSLCDGENVWNCRVTVETFQEKADDLGQAIDVYRENFRDALCHQNGDENLKYSLKEIVDRKLWTFSYSRHLLKDGITVLLGRLDLELSQEEPRPRFMGVIHQLFAHQAQLTDKNGSLEHQLEKERQLAGDALQSLTSFVTEHENNESELYANFVDVLNEKKRKLRQLRDECNALRAELASATAKTIPYEPRKPARGAKAVGRRPKGGAVSRQHKRKEISYEGSDTQTDIEDKRSSEKRTKARRIDSSDSSDGTEFDEGSEVSSIGRVKDKKSLHEGSTVKLDPVKVGGDTNQIDTLLGEIAAENQTGEIVKRAPVKRRSRNVYNSQPVDPQIASQTQSSQRSTRSQIAYAETTQRPNRRSARAAATRSQSLIDDIMDEL